MMYYLRLLVYLFVSFIFSSAHAGAYEDFFRAVNVDNVRTVNQLLERGFDPNAADEKGQVGLYLALREGSLQVAEALLKHPGLKVDAVNAAHETPLMMAALRGNLEWTQRLLDRGAQLNRKGWTPLHYAASGPEPKVVAAGPRRRDRGPVAQRHHAADDGGALWRLRCRRALAGARRRSPCAQRPRPGCSRFRPPG